MLPLALKFERVLQRWQEHLSCSSADCQSAARLWKRVSHGAGSIHLAGKRYCFPDCFERELQRQLQQLRAAPAPQRHSLHRVPLGLLMLSRGDLNQDQLRIALETQRQSGYGHIGEWISELGFAGEQQVTSALGAQWSCPVLWKFADDQADCAIPLPLLRHYRMAPAHYARVTGVIHLAFAGVIEYQAMLAIEQVLQCRVEPCITTSTALARALARFEEERRRGDHVFADSSTSEEMTRISSSYAARLRVQDIRIARSGDYVWLRIEAGIDSVNLLFAKPIARMANTARPITPRYELALASHLNPLGAGAITPEAASPSLNAG